MQIDAENLYEHFINLENLREIAHIDGNNEIFENAKEFLSIQKNFNSNKYTLKSIFEENIDFEKTSLELWKLLLNSSFEYIGLDEKVGVEELYDYLKDFRGFEEVLYGTSPYYRDHTYHSINLYLMGEYLFRKCDMYKDIKMFSRNNQKEKINDKSAIFCIISLTHDLGYPIEKINAINQKILQMYSHYKNIKINELSLEFTIQYQGIFDYLLNILSLSYEILKNKYLFSWEGFPENDNGRLIEFLNRNFGIDWVKTAKIEKIEKGRTIKVSTEKNYLTLKLNDEQTEVNLEIDDGRTDKFVVKIENSKLNICKNKNTDDYERKTKNNKNYIYLKTTPLLKLHHKPELSLALLSHNHGLFSCMKLIEHLRIFKDDYDISLNKLTNAYLNEYFLISQEILKTIYYHSSKNIRINNSNYKLLYLWFNLLDDICEWSRYTKAGGYSIVPGYCKVYVQNFTIDNVEICFRYDEKNPEGLEPHLHFKNLVKKYYQIIDPNPNRDINIKFEIFDDYKHIKYIFNMEGQKKLNLEILARKQNDKDYRKLNFKKGEKINVEFEKSHSQDSSDILLDAIIKKNGFEKIIKNIEKIIKIEEK